MATLPCCLCVASKYVHKYEVRLRILYLLGSNICVLVELHWNRVSSVNMATVNTLTLLQTFTSDTAGDSGQSARAQHPQDFNGAAPEDRGLSGYLASDL